jgi:hypothetical protein
MSLAGPRRCAPKIAPRTCDNTVMSGDKKPGQRRKSQVFRRDALNLASSNFNGFSLVACRLRAVPLGVSVTTGLLQLRAYPDAAEFGIDYKNMRTQAVQPGELALLPGRALFADLVERPTISYLPRRGMRRHYTTPAGWDSPGFYVGDVASFDDLVTYWNLRAPDIALWFVDPNHIDRYAELIPAWEKAAQQIVARHFRDFLGAHRQQRAVNVE